MKASRFSDAQKAFILKQGHDGVPVADICRKAGISQATYFNWKKKYDGLLPTEMRRLKQLEEENGKLKKLVADLSLDKEMLSCTRSLRLSPCPRSAPPRGMAPRPEPDAAHLSRIGPAIAQQNAEAAGQGQAARGSQASDAVERDLGDGLCS